ncbi:MAG: protein kinase [Actinomycetota bacterium]|nr:protein kinase [Actinomycetota bacterium]
MVAGAQDLTGVLLEGRYRVGELIAVGGMSRVYRGVDTRLDRAVAIKVMDNRLAADPVFRGRLEREARAMARIKHPCVVDVHDHGESGPSEEPLVYLVMELIAGATLRDLLVERGALTVPDALAVLEPVLGALAAAHKQGLAHRDVKPENVLISHAGAVKVADFGLVTAATGGLTNSGVIMGTPAYLSPEQVLGEGVGPRTDVYAAGVLLFELLTGQPPFTGEHALSVAYQHVNRDVPAPSTLVPGLPPKLDGLVTRATRRAAEDRPADAETLLFAVRGVRAALGIPTVPVPIPTKAGGRPIPDLDARTRHVPPMPRHATRAITAMDWPPEPATAMLADGPAPVDGLAARDWSDHRWLLAGIGAVLLLGVLAGVGGWSLGGGRDVVTPPVVGLEDQAAQRAITGAGLIPLITERHDDNVAAGLVADESPAAGTEVGKGSEVTLMVSTGHPRVPLIPAGAPVGTAAGLLSEADLTANPDITTRRFHPTAPVGTVVGTSPPTGTELTIGAPVSLVVSKGPAPNRDQERNAANGLRDTILDGLGLGGLLGGN